MELVETDEFEADESEVFLTACVGREDEGGERAGAGQKARDDTAQSATDVRRSKQRRTEYYFPHSSKGAFEIIDRLVTEVQARIAFIERVCSSGQLCIVITALFK